MLILLSNEKIRQSAAFPALYSSGEYTARAQPISKQNQL
jgi:hypothetical protein